MAFFKVRTLQMALGAAVLSLAGLASAQMEPVKPATDSAAAVVQSAKPEMKKHHKHHHKGHHKHHHKGQHKHHHQHGDNAAANRDANSDAPKSQMGGSQGLNQYERNAFARCNVFKTDIDRLACAERVKAGAVSGSVKDGGILRETVIEQVTR